MKWMLIVMVLGVTPVKTGLLFDTLDACRQVAGEMEAEYARYINEGLAWAATQSKTGKVCKIACNIDPLRGHFASNSDPL